MRLSSPTNFVLLGMLLASSYANATKCSLSSDDPTTVSNAVACVKNSSDNTLHVHSFTATRVLNLYTLPDNSIVSFEGTLRFNTSSTIKNHSVALIDIRGTGVTVKGTSSHIIHGGGKPYWYPTNTNIDTKPKLMAFRIPSGKVLNLKVRDPPCQFLQLPSSSGVTVDGLDFQTDAPNHSNTDGIDISGPSVLTNSYIRNTDDCIAFNDATYNVYVKNFTCIGGHGISIGSLGKNGNVAKVHNITVVNSVIKDSENGVRIKVVPNADSNGYCKDIKYSDITLSNVTNPVLIYESYCDPGKRSDCVDGAYAPEGSGTSNIKISNITLKNISGTGSSSTTHNINVACGKGLCSGFKFSNINITPSHAANCENVTISGIC